MHAGMDIRGMGSILPRSLADALPGQPVRLRLP
jgi:hypothetical protein